MELFLGCVLIAAVLVAIGVGAAVLNRSVLEPCVQAAVNRWHRFRGKPQWQRCRMSILDASGKPLVMVDLPLEAFERLLSAMPGATPSAEVDGQAVDLVPRD